MVWASDFDQAGLNRLFGRWAAAKIFKGGGAFGPHCSMAVFDGSALVAVVVMHNWDQDAGVIEFSAASDSRLWLTRRVLREMFTGAFERIGCQTVFMRVSPENETAQGRGIKRILRAYGFACTMLPSMRGRGCDDMLFTLTDDAWRANRFN